jgi:hypothetical protein
MFTNLWREKLVLKLLFNITAIHEKVAEVAGVSERSVRRIANDTDIIEPGTSVSFSASHKLRIEKIYIDTTGHL